MPSTAAKPRTKPHDDRHVLRFAAIYEAMRLRVDETNRIAFDQYVARFMESLSSISPGMHGKIGLTVNAKDGRMMSAEELRQVSIRTVLE